jgi:hypothetical protein
MIVELAPAGVYGQQPVSDGQTLQKSLPKASARGPGDLES